MMRIWIPLALGLVGLAPSMAAAMTLYDVDFNSDVVGSAPATGAGPFTRSTPSQVLLGTPTVVASVGGLTDQPVQLDPSATSQIDSLAFDLGLGLSAYDISLDVLIESFDSGGLGTGTFGLAIIFDTPSSNSFRFQFDEVIRLLVAGSSTQQEIGTYSIGDVLHVEAGVDVDDDEFWVRLDGDLLTEVSIGGSPGISDVGAIRIGTQGLLSQNLVAAVDDIVIRGIPEPTTGALLLFGALLGAVRATHERRRRPRR